LAGGLLLCQWLVALDVKFGPTLNRFGVGERGLRLGKLALSLIERRLERPWIDLEKELALLNESPLLIALLQQVASDLRPDVSVDESVEGTNPFGVDGNIFFLGRARLNGNTSVEQKIPLKGLKTKPRRAVVNYYDDVLATPN